MLLSIETPEGVVWVQLVKRKDKYTVRSAPFTMFFPTEAQRKAREQFARTAIKNFGVDKNEMNEAIAVNMKGKKFAEAKPITSFNEWLIMQAKVQRMWFKPEFRQRVEEAVHSSMPEVKIEWQER